MSNKENTDLNSSIARELVLENEFIKVEIEGNTIHWESKNDEDVDSPLFTTVIQELVKFHQLNKELEKRPKYNLGSVSGREQMIADNLKARGISVLAVCS